MNSPKDKFSGAKGSASSDAMINRIFGAYKIIEQIGRGGMSLVYLAERIDGSFRQQAAVKILKRGMDSEEVIRRFRNERQILAALSHPNIALLYDGGTTAEGLPYFVMEYVDGAPLNIFCDQRKLTVAERLNIFLPICEAVNAAHQIKVVHRDLKPSNILIKPDGTPKLLDFGIAKILAPELTDEPLEQTATQMRLLTPEYASPEQARGDQILPASDIYSLGVLLYELLSGHRPYLLKNRSPYEVARMICEQIPIPLSKALETERPSAGKIPPQTLQELLEARNSDLEKLRGELSGDLEQIVSHALHKNPSERYQSALDLADDIKLYLNGEPIKNRFDAFPKQNVFARTEKPSLAVLPLKIIGAKTDDESYLAVGLADALITKLSNVRRIIVRPTSAVLPFADTENSIAAGRKLETDYVLSGTIRRVGNRVRISTQLVKVNSEATLWAERFDEDLTDVLDLEDRLAEKVGGLLLPQLTGSEQQQLAKRGTNNVAAFDAYLRARYNLFLFTAEGYGKAKAYFEEAIRIDSRYALAYVGLAELYFALTAFGTTPPLIAYPKSREAAQRALEIDNSLGEAYAVLGACGHENFDFAQMEKNLRRSIELNPDYPLSRIWLSNVLTFYGRSAEAIREAEHAVTINPISTFEKRQLAWIYSHNRQLDKALEVSRRAVEAEPDSSYCLSFYSRILRLCGKLADSLETAERSVQIDPQVPLFVTNYAATLAAVGETEKARQVLDKLESLPPEIYVSPFNMAVAYIHLNDYNRVFQLLEKGYQTRDQRIIWIVSDPQFEILRDDSRFQNLLNRLKTPVLY